MRFSNVSSRSVSPINSAPSIRPLLQMTLMDYSMVFHVLQDQIRNKKQNTEHHGTRVLAHQTNRLRVEKVNLVPLT